MQLDSGADALFSSVQKYPLPRAGPWACGEWLWVKAFSLWELREATQLCFQLGAVVDGRHLAN